MKTIFWFRRDLRLEDNAGLYRALKQQTEVQPLFIFDTEILNELPKKDKRVVFILEEIKRLNKELKEYNASLLVKVGKPIAVFKSLIEKNKIQNIYTNHDYEPYAKERDEEVKKLIEDNGGTFHSFKDQCIFEKDEVLKDDGDPYVVFTPYSKVWKNKLNDFYLKPYPTLDYSKHLATSEGFELPSLEELGFEDVTVDAPKREAEKEVIKTYDKTRNFPGTNGTTKMSVHLRFGTISIRALARKALLLNETYLNELIWRDFYMMILHHFPKVVTKSFREKYDEIQWENNKTHFQAWCDGKTGYPMVDAGMRQLNETGYMHNRLRMVTASFLCKHLLIDWRWGEAYFAEKLLDYDLAANNGGWQWAAGCGTDAAPYFRIFNPTTQLEKFDKDKKFVKKFIPELDTSDYPAPIVDHKEAREKCLKRYKVALD